MRNSKQFRAFALATVAGFCFPAMVSAQEQSAPPSDSSSADIIVTARKRAETSINVPVTLTAVGAADIDRRAITGLDALANIVPGLTIMEQGGNLQGGTVSLRGITGPNINVLGDQAVSFSVDGFAVAKSSVRRLAAFDLKQIEVLKGPQALFFGKNSPGGVIALTTADPTPQLEGKVSLGYEAKAHEIRGEGYISGPITEALGGRLAFLVDHARGDVHNTFPAGTPISPGRDWIGRNREYAFRGTLKFDDGGPFTARFKATYDNKRGSGIASNMQAIYCSTGSLPVPPGATPIPGVQEDCKADRTASHPDNGPAFYDVAPYDKRLKGGDNYSKSRQGLVSLEMNYDFSDEIRLTSISGYYNAWSEGLDNFNYPYAETFLPSAGRYKHDEFSQELRVTSSYDGPVNFMMGGLYTKSKTSTEQNTFLGYPPVLDSSGNVIFGAPINIFGLPALTNLNEYNIFQKGEAYSAFAQMQWKPVEKVEFSAGGRYSHEEKRITRAEADFRVFGTFGDPTLPAQPVPAPAPISFSDFSPEVTLAYHPNRNLNVYGSYKRGFLSGGYNGSSDVLLPGQRADYGQQTTKGFEAGVKTAMFNNTLRFNAAAYTYKVSGLQVASFQVGVSTIRNAGKVSVKGFEADVNWQAPVEGLSLHGAMAYNHARYDVYTAPCYTGQTAAGGCTLVIAGQPSQDLAGTAVPNAPDWVLSAGFNYSTPVGTGLKLGLSGDVNYSDSYVTDSKNTPFSRSPSRALVDASVSIGAEDDRWEFSLVGKNLTNQYFWTDSQGYFPPAANGLEDRFAHISRGRELWARVSYKFQ